MEKIFLIGGSGFIGKNLVEYFAPNYEVYVIDRYIDENFFSKLPPPVGFLRLNMTLWLMKSRLYIHHLTIS